MPTNSGTASPTGTAAHASAPQHDHQSIIEYLTNNGYSKTEAMLRVESAHTDADGRPVIAQPDGRPEVLYERSYGRFSARGLSFLL